MGEVGNWTVIWWQVVSEIFVGLPKIIKIRWLILIFKLQSKMLRMFFKTQCIHYGSGDFRPKMGGTALPPVSWLPMFFAKITQIFDFLPFKILEKRPNLQLPLNVQKPKLLQLQRGFSPWHPDQGPCPWTSLTGVRSRSPSGGGVPPDIAG